MVKRIGRARRKTRQILKKSWREKGKVAISKRLQSFEPGEGVVLKAEPAIQKGMYFHRFHGKMGKVHAKRGRCFEVMVKDQGKEKMLVVDPVHLKKLYR